MGKFIKMLMKISMQSSLILNEIKFSLERSKVSLIDRSMCQFFEEERERERIGPEEHSKEIEQKGTESLMSVKNTAEKQSPTKTMTEQLIISKIYKTIVDRATRFSQHVKWRLDETFEQHFHLSMNTLFV